MSSGIDMTENSGRTVWSTGDIRYGHRQRQRNKQSRVRRDRVAGAMVIWIGMERNALSPHSTAESSPSSAIAQR